MLAITEHEWLIKKGFITKVNHSPVPINVITLIEANRNLHKLIAKADRKQGKQLTRIMKANSQIILSNL